MRKPGAKSQQVNDEDSEAIKERLTDDVGAPYSDIGWNGCPFFSSTRGIFFSFFFFSLPVRFIFVAYSLLVA